MASFRTPPESVVVQLDLSKLMPQAFSPAIEMSRMPPSRVQADFFGPLTPTCLAEAVDTMETVPASWS